MTKIEKNDIIKILAEAIIGGVFSTFFTWLFTFLTNSLNPLIILYAILSALGTLILFWLIKKLLIKAYDYLLYWYKNQKYLDKIEQNVEAMRHDLLSKEIFIVKVRDFGQYLDPKISFYKPSRSAIDIYNPNSVKESTKEVINTMIMNDILIYIESLGLFLLKEKMICVKCAGGIEFEDKVDFVEARCKSCSLEYRISHEGLWNVNEGGGIERYISIKNPNRPRGYY